MTNGSRAVLQRARKQAGALRDIYRRSHQRRAWIRARHAESPSFRDAVAADVAVTLHYRGEGRTHLSRTELLAEALRLTFSTDAFLAQVLYRGRVAALRRGVPVVPRLCHVGAMTLSQVCIGDPVVIAPGLYLPHGQIVIDGITQLSSNVTVFPWTTIGLRAGDFTGPRISEGVHVGTGAKVLGAVEIGANARVGANAVVIRHVAGGDTVVGVPAHTLPAGTGPTGTPVTWRN